MLFCNQPLFAQTSSLKRGEMALPSCLEVLRERIFERFGIRILNIVYDTIEIGPHEGKPRLEVIVESEDDIKKSHKDRLFPRDDVKETIQKEFAKLVEQLDLHDSYKTNGVLVVFDDFSRAAREKAVKKFLEKHAERLVKKWAANRVWRLEGPFDYVVAFFEDEKTKQAAAENGTQEQIRQECYRLVKQYDEFNYVDPEAFSIVFDSKENLNKHYAGNLYYYFK